MYRKTLQTSVAAAALFAFTAAYSAPASAADDTFKTGSKASLTMSGQVDRAVLFADDGTNSAIFHVDNDNSSTRIRWVGKGKVTDKVSIGMLWESQFESNSTASVNIGDKEKSKGEVEGAAPKDTALLTERKLEWWISHTDVGKLTVGQGDTASNGSAEISLSGMAPAMYAGIGDTAGGILFRRSNQLESELDNVSDGPRINQAWTQHDGASRQDRIRYDTPKIAGFVASASHIQGDDWDIGLRHSGKFGQFKTSAALFYVNFEGKSQSREGMVDGSVSVLHDSGLNVTFSAGTRDNETAGRSDDTHFYVMLGYVAKIFDIGNTHFGIDYAMADDVNAEGDEFETFGIAVNQKVKAIGTDIYAVFRNHSLDRTSESFDDVNVFLAGARVRF